MKQEIEYPIRATTPKEFNREIHVVTKFKRENYDGFYLRTSNDNYQYQGISSESSIHYTEGALLGLSNMEVVEYKDKIHLDILNNGWKPDWNKTIEKL